MVYNLQQRVRKYLRQKLYHQETGYYLNYFTLQISEPTIAQECRTHKVNQFERMFWPIVLSFIASFSFSCYQLFIQKNGHPLLLVTGAVCLLIGVIIAILLRTKKMGISTFPEMISIGYMLNHAIATVCCYKGWLPVSFNKYPKDIFEFQIVLNFILVNAIPLLDFSWTILLMFPILLASSYI